MDGGSKMQDIKKTIGNNLRYIRFQKGLSQEKFYEQFNLNPKYLASIERGEINIGVEFLANLAIALEVPITELILEDTKKKITKRRVDQKRNLSK